MKTPLFALLLVMAGGASPALAEQMTAGEDFLQVWDLNQDGSATSEEIQKMRGNLFPAFDTNKDGYLDAEEYVVFDQARNHDLDEFDGKQRTLMLRITNGMSLSVNDTNGDGQVSKDEFLDGADAWLNDLDSTGDGVLTLEDFDVSG